MCEKIKISSTKPTQKSMSLIITSMILWKVALAACMPIGMRVHSNFPHGKLMAVLG